MERLMTAAFIMTAWPAKDLEEFQVYELEVEVGWWTLNVRVHADDIADVMHEAVDAWRTQRTPEP